MSRTPYKPGKKLLTSAPTSASASSSSSTKKKSLAQQIAELTNPTPKDFDPEDVESGGAMNARVTDDYDGEEAPEQTSASRLLSERSTIRKNFDVEDVSAEYQGRIVSRKKLQQFSDDEEEDEEEEGEEEDEQDDDEEMNEAEDGDENEDGDDDDNEQVDDESGEDEDAEDEGETELTDQQLAVQRQLAALEEEDEAPTSLFQPRGAKAASSSSSTAGGISSSSASSQLSKSLAVKNQLAWYSQLLNLRIRLQGILTQSNRLPPESSEILSSLLETPQVTPAYSQAYNSASKMLEGLFELQSGLMQQNKKVFGGGNEDGNNEVPKFEKYVSSVGKKRKTRDEEEERKQLADNDDGEDDDSSINTQSHSLDTYWEYMSTQVTPFFEPIQNALIEKWNQKTQLSAGVINGAQGGKGQQLSSAAGSTSNFKSINQSLLKQIDNILLDESRLVKRSQLNRNASTLGAELLGRVEQEKQRMEKSKKQKLNHDNSNDKSDSMLDNDLLSGRYTEEYDSFIYDDNDYYQQLLSEIISHNSELSGDGDLLTRASAARKKTRKGGQLVDRRASKGRKLRYTVHAKLANFMAPKPAPITTEYGVKRDANGPAENGGLMNAGSGFAMDELFMNLFGGAGSAPNTK